MHQYNFTLRYFDAEMRYLREAGQEFAQAFPEQAVHLGLNQPHSPDAYVERLFQGFAFLMGRLREKLDDDLPELTEGLVSLLWSQYLRTVPSLSVVELAPDLERMGENQTLSKGFEVLSQPVGPKRTRCRYSTTQDLTLRALAIETLQAVQELDGSSLLRLRIRRGVLADWSKLDLSRIPLYLNAEPTLASALHEALTWNCRGLYLRTPGQQDRRPLDAHFTAKGFDDDDGLWPKGPSAFSGYQLLLEYFTLPEKFMFVTLHGLERAQLSAQADWFELEIVLGQPWPIGLEPRAENLCLHAVPVINLFALEADPLTLDPLQNEYLLRPKRLNSGYTEIYAVDRVCTLRKSARHDYVAFSSFQHKGGMLRDQTPERYFHTRVKQGASGLYDTWLILGGEGFKTDGAAGDESLSLQLTGTNGQLPRHALQAILLDSPAEPGHLNLRVRNLCTPTSPCQPPNRDRFHWRILSHLGSSFLPMLESAEVLRGTLALYDWTASESNRRRLAAIVGVEHFSLERFEKGLLLRGVDIEVTLNEDAFAGMGDVRLFGELLSCFFALYADIHLFNQLTLILQPSGECLRWNENHSRRIPG